MATQPVLLLTFSNDKDSYLPMIVAEQKAIKQALLDYDDRNCLRVRDVQHASTEEVFGLVNRYNRQVCLLHYGGHADGQSLQLEKDIGLVQTAHVKGIAGLLGSLEQLKLVFLNGCATEGQVKALLDSGVPAVIATRVSINDEHAQQFAGQFYEAMAGGGTIREAFLRAKAFLEITEGHPPVKTIEETRGPALRGGGKQPIPWGLYWKADAAGVLDWALPTEPYYAISLDAEPYQRRDNRGVNSIIVDTTLKAIRDSAFVRELARTINQERQAGNRQRKPTDAEKKDALIRSYPAPVSVNLRELFSKELSTKHDEKRLRRLLAAYRKTMEFVAFTLLSDLWDAAYRRQQPLELSAAERLQLEAFFGLNAYTAPSFDYFQLAGALLTAAHRNGVSLFVEGLNQYPEGWAQHAPLAEASQHFQLMRTEMENDIPSRLMEPYSLASEQHLTNVLCELHFLVHYQMAVVKYIEVQQLKNMPPTAFKHIIVELDNTYRDLGDEDKRQDLEAPTDMEAVLLYRGHLKDNLNLSPFILDENALVRDVNSKVYFFSHSSEAALHYFWIENDEDTLLISEQPYGYIKRQFEKARQLMLNEQPPGEGDAGLGDEDDIISVL